MNITMLENGGENCLRVIVDNTYIVYILKDSKMMFVERVKGVDKLGEPLTNELIRFVKSEIPNINAGKYQLSTERIEALKNQYESRKPNLVKAREKFLAKPKKELKAPERFIELYKRTRKKEIKVQEAVDMLDIAWSTWYSWRDAYETQQFNKNKKDLKK